MTWNVDFMFGLCAGITSTGLMVYVFLSRRPDVSVPLSATEPNWSSESTDVTMPYLAETTVTISPDVVTVEPVRARRGRKPSRTSSYTKTTTKARKAKTART